VAYAIRLAHATRQQDTTKRNVFFYRKGYMTNALAKLDKATQMLAEAKTLDEVKGIMDVAEAARTYAKAARLGLEAQNHAAEVKLRAERKAGDMLARLEREPGKRTDKQPDTSMVQGSEYREVLDEQEIPNTTAHRWQEIYNIPDKKFEQHIAEVIETGGELTTAGLLKAVKDMPHVLHNSGENEWYTPPEYIAAAVEVMGRIDLDPASSERANKIVAASKFYTAEDDGLTKFWAGKVWMNPPYSTEYVRHFANKYAEHVKNGDISEGIVLVNNATETNWFNELINVSSAVVFPTGRIKFIDKNNNAAGAPLQGQTVIYAGKNIQKFLEVFGSFGWGAEICKEA
jgi:phage N-6-adenine-methyltransferase